MTSPPPPRHHHYVPTFYLAGFTGDGSRDGRLIVTDLADKRQYPSTPVKAGKERDFYSVDSTNDDSAIVEKWLADNIDGPAATALAKTLAAGKMLDRKDDDYEWLMAFVASMVIRGQFFRERVNDFNDRIAKRRMWYVANNDALFKRFVESIPPDKREKQGFDETKMREFLKSEAYTVSMNQTPLIGLMLQSLPILMATMIHRTWALATSIDEDAHFVTSDFPVPVVAMEHLGPFGPAYGMPKTMVFFPLTRQHVLVGTHEGKEQLSRCNRAMLGIVNGYVAFHAHRFVYSPTMEVVWLDDKKRLQGTAELFVRRSNPTAEST